MATAKIAIVTGAGTGVGRGAALALMKAGFTVVLAGRRRDKLQEVANEGAAKGGQSLIVPADIADPASIKTLFATTKQAFGRLDVLFNNAGIGAPPVPIEDLPLREMESRRRHQPQRHVSVHAGSDPHHEGSDPARRAHHQQRLDLGAYAAPALHRLYGDQARDHRPDQVDRARRARLRHRLRADRHRQCGLPAHRTHGRGRRVLQPNGQKMLEPRMDVEHVGEAVAYMASLPLDANVLFMTVMATKMPFVGRG